MKLPSQSVDTQAAAAPIETRFVDANDCTFEVLTCGTGDRLAMCLHGFPEHAHSWRYQMPCLAALGYRVWAPNLRGYGRSTRPPRMADYAIENLLDDVQGLIEAAGPAREVVLLAHDWGAVLAWQIGMHRAQLIDRLVIMNVPHPACMQRELRVNPQQRRSSWYVAFFQLPWLPEWLLARDQGARIAEIFRSSARHPENFSAADLAVFRENAASSVQLGAMINWYRALVRGGGMRRMAALGMPVITVPTMLLWGEQDMALTKATTYATEDWVDELTVRYIPDASHWVQQDAPETVNAMLAAWLAGDVPPHAPGITEFSGDRDPVRGGG